MKTPKLSLILAAGFLSAGLAASPHIGHAKPGKAPRIQLHQPGSSPGQSQHFQMSFQSRGRLGAQVLSISPELRTHFGAGADRGLLVDHVLPDSPAAKAGLKTGDVIVSVEGEAIGEAWDIFGALADKKSGEVVKIEIVRNKKPKTLSVTLDNDAAPMPVQPFGNGQNFDFNFGPNFPFGSQGVQPFAAPDMQKRMQELEQRLQELEKLRVAPRKAKSPKAAPKKSSAPKKDSEKSVDADKLQSGPTS